MRSAQRELIDVLETAVLPWAKSGVLRPVLARLPLILPRDMAPVSSRAAKLAKPEHQPYSLNPERWPALGLHACRYPSLACLLDGEADLLVGVTREMAAQAGEPTAANTVRILSLSRQHILLFPAGTPNSDSSRAHWERSGTAADSRILWLRVLPMGAIAQLCHTRNGQHYDTPAVFVNSPQCSPLMQVLMGAAAEQNPPEELVASCLLTLVLCIHRSWASSREVGEHDTAQLMTTAVDAERHGLDGTAARIAAVERACAYIQTNLMHRLTVPEIAHNAYVSVPQLKRIFRSELDTPVMKYVTNRRLHEVRTLLANTDIAIHEIAFLCGYSHRTHFTRAFTNWAGMAPQEFRRRHRQQGTPHGRKRPDGHMKLD